MALICLFLCGRPVAATNLPPMAEGSSVTDENISQDVTLKLDQKSCSRFDINLVATITNSTKNAYGFGYDYTLEQKINGDWNKLKKQADTPAVGLYLGSKKKLSMELLLTDQTGVSGVYGALTPGQYRIAWPIQNEETKQISYLTAEFTIVPDTVLYALEPVNLRKGPSAENDTIRELRLGEQVTLIRKTGKWSKVMAGEQVGYVYAKYLAASESAAYYNHWVAKGIGKSKIKSIIKMKDVKLKELWFGFDYLQYKYEGIDKNKLFTPVSAEKCFEVTFKKPYNEFELYFFCYASPEAAKKEAEIIKQQAETSVLLPDQQLKWFYLDDAMLIVFLGEHPIGSYTKAQDSFYRHIGEMLHEESSYIAYSDFM